MKMSITWSERFFIVEVLEIIHDQISAKDSWLDRGRDYFFSKYGTFLPFPFITGAAVFKITKSWGTEKPIQDIKTANIISILTVRKET